MNKKKDNKWYTRCRKCQNKNYFNTDTCTNCGSCLKNCARIGGSN